MFSLKWSLYNKTPWDYLREYSDDKKINTNETGIKKDLTPEEMMKSENIMIYKKEERNQLKYEYLERGREFGNYEGIYKSIRPMFGQRPTANTKDTTFKNYPVDENSFQFVKLKNLKPLNATTMSELYDELNNLSKIETYTTDKKFFNRFTELDYFKNMTKTQELNRTKNLDNLQKINDDFEKYKSDKIKEREDEIKKYFNEKMKNMSVLEIYNKGLDVGQKGKLYTANLTDIEYLPKETIDDEMKSIVNEYRKLYQ
eukprot:gene11187-4007_t